MVGEQDVRERELAAIEELQAAAPPGRRRRSSPRDPRARPRPRRCWTGSRRSSSARRSRDGAYSLACAVMSLLHTCYRITDIDRSVAFYEALGFEERRRAPIRDEAINVFMSLPDDGPEPKLELTYNFGVDSYELGTAYGHIAIAARRPRRHARAAEGARDRARATAVHGQRGRQPPVLRARSGQLPGRISIARRADIASLQSADGRPVQDRHPAQQVAMGVERPRPREPRPPHLGDRDGALRHRAARPRGGRGARSRASSFKPTAGRPASSASCATASTTRARSRKRKRSSTRWPSRSSPSRSRRRAPRRGSGRPSSAGVGGRIEDRGS